MPKIIFVVVGWVGAYQQLMLTNVVKHPLFNLNLIFPPPPATG